MRLGLPTRFVPSTGQEADITYAPAQLERVLAAVVISDKGYDQQELVNAVEARGGEAVIPSWENRTVPRTGTRAATWSSGSGPRPNSTAGSPPVTRKPLATSSHSFKWRPS